MRRTRSGQALVEFALILPIFLLLILGGVGVHLLLLHRQELQAAAYETAFAVADAEGDCSIAEARMRQLLDAPVELVCSPGEIVTIEATGTYAAILPMLPERIHVTARAVRR